MNKTLVMVALVSTAAFATHRWTRSDAPAPAAAQEQLAINRIWIDHIPTNERDTIQVFAAISEESVGLFQAVSSWKGAYELFTFEAHGNEIRVRYPHTGDRETIKASARACSEKQMDYCLELTGNSRGVKKYYSRKGWEIDGAMTADQLDERALQLLAK